MLDISNLMIRIKTRTHLLSPDVIYGVHLVFKFCDSRKVSRKPIYVNLKYTKDSEILHAYFAILRDEDWMMIELFRFLNHKKDSKFKFIIESLSTNYCGDGAVFVEGIEFRAIHNASLDIFFVP
ncbi:kinase-like domain, phloem protein 2-like protein, partial [Tanacetum coccineum]